MAAVAVQKRQCEVVELSSDEDEMPKLKERETTRQGSSQLPARGSKTSIVPNRVVSMPTALPDPPCCPSDIFTFGSSPGLPRDKPSSNSSQKFLPPPPLPHLLIDRFPLPTDDDTPMRQAAKRRKLNILSDASSTVEGSGSHRLSSLPAPALSSEPELRARSLREESQQREKSTRLKDLQAALGFSDGDLSNSEVAVGGSDQRLPKFEAARLEKEREYSSSGGWNFGNENRQMEERELERSRQLLEQEGGQKEIKKTIRQQPTILDLSEYFDDDLEEPLPPLRALATTVKTTEDQREFPGVTPRQLEDSTKDEVSAEGSKGKKTPIIATDKRRVSIVSLDSDPVLSALSPEPANRVKRTTGGIWDLNVDDDENEFDDHHGIETNVQNLDQPDEQHNNEKHEGTEHDAFVDMPDFLRDGLEEEQPRLSESTTQLLARISAKSKAKSRHRPTSGGTRDVAKPVPRRSGLSRTASLQSVSHESISASEDTSKKAVIKKPRLTSIEREEQKQEKDRERAHKAEERAKGKEEKEEQKRLDKERKAREKQVAADLAEANKARTDRKVTTPEMIVDLPRSIEGTSVHTQIAPFLSDLRVQSTTYDSPVPDVIRFRRKVTARWSDALGHWEPAPQIIESEKHVLCLVQGQDFAEIASQENGLENHVDKVRRAYSGSQPIYLIEGIETLLRKSRNSNNRAYMAAVRNQLPDVQGSQSQSQKRKPSKANEIVDADVIEDGLLQLQVLQKVLVHHTNTSVETAQWVAVFTQHISTIPYKIPRGTQEASFCMDVGQVRTGEDAADTYVKMLQEIGRVTTPVALSIANEFSDVTSLVRGFMEGGPLILEDIRKIANKNGAVSDARIGPALSRRLYKVFKGKDPAAMDF